MSLLAPLFMFGALAVAAPVIFHLIRRTTRERVRFSSLMFFQPTPPRLTKRSRIENWLLLVLRALALALLALAFARPFWRTSTPPPAAAAAGGRALVLVDVSSSLRREGLWEQAQERTRSVFREESVRHDMALMAFDRQTRSLMNFDEWRSLPSESRLSEIEGRLETLHPTWMGTHLASALTTAAEALVEGDGEAAGAARRLVVVSDFQEGSRLEAIQSYEWPKGVELTLIPVAATAPGNAGLQLAPPVAESATLTAEPGVRVRVWNASDSAHETFQVGWAGEAGDTFEGPAVDAYVPPGQSRLVTIPWPTEGPAAGQIRLAGDSADFDNRVSVAPPPQTRVTLLHLGQADTQDPRSPLFFLAKALPQSSRLAVDVVSVPPGQPLKPEVLGQAKIIVISEPLDPANAGEVRSRVEKGAATALVVLTSPGMADTLSALAGTGSITLNEITPETYAMLGEIDFRHPLFAPFADPRFSDFTKIRFLRYRQIDQAAFADARAVARFDSGDPAIVEIKSGEGQLLVLAASWVPAESQLAVSSKFPPLLASMLEWSGATRLAPASYAVGDPLPRLAMGDLEKAPVTIRTPSGTDHSLSPDDSAFSGTDQPGLYLATIADQSRAIPVNLDPMESRTTPMSEDEFERLGAPMARTAERERAESKKAALAPAVEAENRQKLWRWFLAAALAVLLLETLIAGRAARQTITPAEATP